MLDQFLTMQYNTGISAAPAIHGRGWGVGGLAKIVNTVFDAQFFSKKLKIKKINYYYYLKI
jgi:hypothetical protein